MKKEICNKSLCKADQCKTSIEAKVCFTKPKGLCTVPEGVSVTKQSKWEYRVFDSTFKPKDRRSKVFLSSSKEECINSKRYTVYAYEIKRRYICLFICSLFTFVCAYIHRVSLMYSIISSLQKMHYIKAFGDNGVVGEDCPSVESTSLIFTDVQEAFSFTLYVCSFWCVYTCLPIYVYHLFCFLSPGWHLSFRNKVFLHTFTYLFSAYFLWWIVDKYYLSKILSFFYGFSIDGQGFCIHAQTKVFSYLSWYLSVFVLYICIFSLSAIFWVYKQTQIMFTTFPIKDSIQKQNIKHTIQQSCALNTNNVKPVRCKNGVVQNEVLSGSGFTKPKGLCAVPEGLSVTKQSKWENEVFAKHRHSPTESKAHPFWFVKTAKAFVPWGTDATTKRSIRYPYISEPFPGESFEQKHRGKMWWVCLLCAAFLSPPEGIYQLLCTFLFISLFELICCISYLSYSRHKYTKLCIQTCLQT